MKKVLALILCLSVLLGFASCAKKVEVPSKSDVKKAAAEEYDMDFKVDSEDVSDDEKEAEWVLISKDGTLEVTVTWNAKKPDEFEFDDKELVAPTETETETEAPTTTESETEAPTTTTTSESETSGDGTTASGVAPSGASYVNFDEMNFYIKGKKFTLGKTTLQDLIDDGVPFEDGELEDAKNNLKSKYQSSYIKLNPGVKGYYVWIQVFNETDSGKPMNECYINEILYKKTTLVKDGETQDFVTFDFPLDLTMDQLKANSGEPNNDPFHYEDGDYISDTLRYTHESERYYNDSCYEFDFLRGTLDSVRMTYIP